MQLTIDGLQATVAKGSTVLDAARSVGIDIPTLCHLPEVCTPAACRICVVEIDGYRNLPASCHTPATEGMVVRTNTASVRAARRTNLQLLLARHPQECLSCTRNGGCELRALADRFGVREIPYTLPSGAAEKRLDESTPSIVRDSAKCILCRRCETVCGQIQGVGAIAAGYRGGRTVIGPAFGGDLADQACALCGQCVQVCPTGALSIHSDVHKVWAAIADPDVHVVVQTAPAVRVALGEEFGMPSGTIVTGKLVSGLRRLGFDRVFDTDFTADLTILEEGTELLQRVQQGGTLPLITSCSPGWIKFCEHNYPDLLDHLSTCKSPQQMFGALAKTYYAKSAGVAPSKVFSVSIMPCTAKKFEALRPEMRASGYQDVDVVLTTRELAAMLKEAGIQFDQLPSEEYDAPLGISTGAGVIFGATGGVMEAALRSVYEIVTGQELATLEFYAVRGLEGVKEATVMVGDLAVKVAIAHGLANARKLMDRLRAGEADYHFIEIMCCPGGCIGGGGQPGPVDQQLRRERSAAIYNADQQLPLRKSHCNPAVQALYKEYLGEPCGHRSHELLHTHYHDRS